MRVKRLKVPAAFLLSGAVFVACGGKKNQEERRSETVVDVNPSIVLESPGEDRSIGDSTGSIRVMATEVLRQKLRSGELMGPNASALNAAVTGDPSAPGNQNPTVKPSSLYIQLSRELLAQGHLFGGVITTVSKQDSEKLGRLKLSDLAAVHVRPYVAKVQDKPEALAVVLVGCLSKCSESSAQQQILGLPIVGMTPDASQLVLDVSAFGESLNLMDVLDPNGEYTGLKTIATRTSAVDKSDGTIVWDVEHKMVAKDSTPADHPEEILVGVRYYLKIESALNSAFVSRKQVPGVGFFTTERAEEQLITRFSQTEFNGKPIHYFIKNVPAEHQAAFAASFEGWNSTFADEIGRPLISYEFVPAGDPKNDLLTPGDVRFNILEWDLKNLAPYGGLGPSIASQTTGEIFSANVLVQGPTIEKLYKEWFRVAKSAQQLIADKQETAAEELIVSTRRKILAQLSQSELAGKAEISLGRNLKFKTHSQDERLQDRVAARQDFFDIPAGETYETYMAGYFKDMITHELGHNMGLRHNFKGNLFASSDSSKPSQSIMEYLNREFRHKDEIGAYDRMAIKYGYGGTVPSRTDMFCTDEDVVGAGQPNLSAECSRDDATSDPFGYFGKILDRVLDRAVAPNSDQAPTWTIGDLEGQLTLGLSGRLAYAASAKATSKSWLTWSQDNRPTRSNSIPKFVLRTLQNQLCAPAILNAAQGKSSEEARAATLRNLSGLQAKITEVSAKFGFVDGLKCVP